MQALQAWKIKKEQERRVAGAVVDAVAGASSAPAGVVRMAGELPDQIPAVAAAIEGLSLTPQVGSSVMDSWKAQIARQEAGIPAVSPRALNGPPNPAVESPEHFVARRIRGMSEEEKAPGYDKLASKLRMEYGAAVREARAPKLSVSKADPVPNVEAANMAAKEIYMAKRKIARERGGEEAEIEVIKDKLIKQIAEDRKSGEVPLIPTEELSEDMWRRHREKMFNLDIDERMVVQQAMDPEISRSYVEWNGQFSYEDQMDDLGKIGRLTSMDQAIDNEDWRYFGVE